MGQSQSIFIYSPLKYVDYTSSLNPDIKNKLESYLIHTLIKDFKIIMDDRWREIVRTMCHKIKCISEGWEVLPTIHFTIGDNGVVCVKKILDSVS